MVVKKDDEAVDAPVMGTPPVEVASPVTAEADKGQVVLATKLTQALALPDLGKDGVTITSSGVALSKADAEKARKAAADCGVELIEKES